MRSAAGALRVPIHMAVRSVPIEEPSAAPSADVALYSLEGPDAGQQARCHALEDAVRHRHVVSRPRHDNSSTEFAPGSSFRVVPSPPRRRSDTVVIARDARTRTASRLATLPPNGGAQERHEPRSEGAKRRWWAERPASVLARRERERARRATTYSSGWRVRP